MVRSSCIVETGSSWTHSLSRSHAVPTICQAQRIREVTIQSQPQSQAAPRLMGDRQ